MGESVQRVWFRLNEKLIQRFQIFPLKLHGHNIF